MITFLIVLYFIYIFSDVAKTVINIRNWYILFVRKSIFICLSFDSTLHIPSVLGLWSVQAPSPLEYTSDIKSAYFWFETCASVYEIINNFQTLLLHCENCSIFPFLYFWQSNVPYI